MIKLKVRLDGWIAMPLMNGEAAEVPAVVDASGKRYALLQDDASGLLAWDCDPAHEAVAAELSLKAEPVTHYRGYVIGAYHMRLHMHFISKDGEHIGSAPSLDDARKYIDFIMPEPVKPAKRAKPAAVDATPEQLARLKAFAAEHGAGWKRKLLDLWQSGHDASQVDGHLLRQVRNQLGPRWLASQPAIYWKE